MRFSTTPVMIIRCNFQRHLGLIQKSNYDRAVQQIQTQMTLKVTTYYHDWCSRKSHLRQLTLLGACRYNNILGLLVLNVIYTWKSGTYLVIQRSSCLNLHFLGEIFALRHSPFNAEHEYNISSKKTVCRVTWLFLGALLIVLRYVVLPGYFSEPF